MLLLEPFNGVDFDRFVMMSNSSRSELGDVCAPIGDGRAYRKHSYFKPIQLEIRFHLPQLLVPMDQLMYAFAP